MADAQLVKMLQEEGVDTWNHFVGKQGAGWWADLSGTNFSEADLSGIDFSEADLRGANLRGASMRESDLRAAEFVAADLGGADLLGADLRGANLFNANLLLAILCGADLGDANLKKSDLCGADLRGANLNGAQLSEAKLRDADLRGANLSNTVFQSADLSHGDLRGADLRDADLSEASLIGANLDYAGLHFADLRRADLRDTDLRNANLTGADLRGTDFSSARFQYALLVEVDISWANGLAAIDHQGPSVVDNRTLLLSRGKIPDAFLRGCGYLDWEIAAARLYDPDLTEAQRIEVHYRVIEFQSMAPLQRNPLFISYAHSDSRFVDRFQRALNEKGVRSWRDVHHAEAGPLDKVIDRAIAQNPTMVLVLSEASANSDWVAWEVDKAIQLETKLKRPVLCPIALDDSWSKWLSPPHQARLKRYTILDYSAKDAINRQMPRLLKGLDIHYRGEGGGGGWSGTGADTQRRGG